MGLLTAQTKKQLTAAEPPASFWQKLVTWVKTPCSTNQANELPVSSADAEAPWVLSPADAEMMRRIENPDEPKGKAVLRCGAARQATADFLR
jgi:hypothetical protein